MRPEVILLTGRPGVGKTTLVREIVSSATLQFGGFYTIAATEHGTRTGFEIVTIDGSRALLAEKAGDNGHPRVGAYRVNVEAIDQVAIPSMLRAVAKRQTVVVDEIGPMEVLSSRFQLAIQEIVNDENVAVFGTIVQRSCSFADQIKAHPRVRLIALTVANRGEWARSLPALLAV